MVGKQESRVEGRGTELVDTGGIYTIRCHGVVNDCRVILGSPYRAVKLSSGWARKLV